MADADRELCRVCGTPLYDNPDLRPDRLCPRHLAEARAASPPFACTSADLAARDPDNDPICEECDHPWSKHEFGGCVQLTARFVTSYGEIIEDTGPHRCGCTAYDPMCMAPEPLPVASIEKSAPP
jgi:hypothetical protein